MLALGKMQNFFGFTRNIKFNWKNIAIFLVFEFFFSAVTAPLIIFYGPFDNIKSIVVGSFYTTMRHKYLAEFFLSQDAIERIIGKDGYYTQAEARQEQALTDQPVEDIKIQASQSANVQKFDIDGGRSFKGYLIQIDDPTMVKVGYSSKLPLEGERTSSIAKRNKAFAAINAGGFTYNEAWASTGGGFEGFIMHNGKVIGNALPDDDTPDDAIGITDKGQLIFGRYSVNDLKKKNVKEAICFFGPQLIVNGKKMFSAGETGGLGYAPRTAIGQKATGEIVFLVVDGRDLLGALGASMFDLQEILHAQGVVNAINLDGGSSSALYYDGRIINKQTNSTGERPIPSIFMVPQPQGGNK